MFGNFGPGGDTYLQQQDTNKSYCCKTFRQSHIDLKDQKMKKLHENKTGNDKQFCYFGQEVEKCTVDQTLLFILKFFIEKCQIYVYIQNDSNSIKVKKSLESLKYLKNGSSSKDMTIT